MLDKNDFIGYVKFLLHTIVISISDATDIHMFHASRFNSRRVQLIEQLISLSSQVFIDQCDIALSELFDMCMKYSHLSFETDKKETYAILSHKEKQTRVCIPNTFVTAFCSFHLYIHVGLYVQVLISNKLLHDTDIESVVKSIVDHLFPILCKCHTYIIDSLVTPLKQLNHNKLIRF